MSCLIHHFSHNVRSTYLTYSHFYYLHLSIPYILLIYISSFIFLSNLSFRIFHLSISFTFLFPIFTSISVAERSSFACVLKSLGIFSQGKNNIYDFSKPLLDSFSCWLSIVPTKYFGDLLSRYFPPYKIWPFGQKYITPPTISFVWISFGLLHRDPK